jgi:outer membrane protein assembly factor BamB
MDEMHVTTGLGRRNLMPRRGVLWKLEVEGVDLFCADVAGDEGDFAGGQAGPGAGAELAGELADLLQVGDYALKASTGALLWNYTTSGTVDSSPAVANGVVYVGGGDSNVYALSAGTGVLLWKFATGSSVSSSPAVANGVVYVGSDDGNLYAFGLKGGVAQTAPKRPNPMMLRP